MIGRGFSYGLLRAVASLEDAALQASLEKLAEADILWSRVCRLRATRVFSGEKRLATADHVNSSSSAFASFRSSVSNPSVNQP